jgi:hypothetical protein
MTLKLLLGGALLGCLVPNVTAAQTVSERLRECALASRTALPLDPRDASSPQLRDEAHKRVLEFQASMSRAEFDECMMLSLVGFEHGFDPVTYVLEPGRWIELNLGGITIVGPGTNTHFRWGIGGREGIRFLPPRYSEIVSGRPDTRRHFIELFFWTPESPRRDTWQLTWHVFEVAGNDLFPSGAHRLLRVTASQPPPTASLNVLEMISVRANDAGVVEWRAGADPDASGIIPSPADRRVRDERSMKEKEAYDKVDWKRVGDVRRAPALTYGDSSGCGLIVAQGWSDDRMEAIYLQADAELLRLTATPQTFDIARQPVAIQLTAHVYAHPVRSSPFCTDLGQQTGPSEVWRAIGGQITIQVVRGVDATGSPAPRATIRLTGAVFTNGQGARVTQVQPIVLTATVGSFHG